MHTSHIYAVTVSNLILKLDVFIRLVRVLWFIFLSVNILMASPDMGSNTIVLVFESFLILSSKYLFLCLTFKNENNLYLNTFLKYLTFSNTFKEFSNTLSVSKFMFHDHM